MRYFISICRRRGIAASLGPIAEPEYGGPQVAKTSVIWLLLALVAVPRAEAWGDLGHEVTALVAYRHLTPKARSALNALLASDTDTLTKPDFASRATWADKYRNTHRETAAWHFVDIEIDHPDLKAACFGFPALAPGQTASQGPERDCVVNKIESFAGELASSTTSPAERLLALKFLIHFVGDVHQPLHSADHDDRGGNCIGLSPPPDGTDKNLHAYWDVGAVAALGKSAESIADRLDEGITIAEMQAWTAGTPRNWAMETFELARRDAYALSARPTCAAPGTVVLSAGYETTAQKDASAQLLKAAVRMAGILNKALAPDTAQQR
jgi:S1/P1 Nuclease